MGLQKREECLLLFFLRSGPDYIRIIFACYYGRVDPETGEILPTDGRCRKNSPYQKIEKTELDEIMERIKPLKMSEIRREVVRLELKETKM